ncbi:MAG TPA: response regulator transcription factor [Thermodesulfobacteriota bacterium]|nr:response regulator transcription factor [Thermodesulfobacteriota bacterium]
MAFSEKILNLKTLIVEDNASFREILKDKLQTLFSSMAIYKTAEGREALQKLDALEPDLVFMDIRLPGENGIQLTQKIRAKYPNTKVIILTSYDSLQYRGAAIQSGGNCYIPKDSLGYIQIEKLVEALIE